jgi:hypothetical protein
MCFEQHLLAAYEIEVRRHVEFTRGGRPVTTIDQRQHRPDDFTYYEVGGDPFVTAGIVGRTQNMQPPIAPAVDATVPTTIESLVTQWIWWKEQRSRVGQRL